MTPFSNTSEVFMAVFGSERVSETFHKMISQKLEAEQEGFNLYFWFRDTGITRPRSQRVGLARRGFDAGHVGL